MEVFDFGAVRRDGKLVPAKAPTPTSAFTQLLYKSQEGVLLKHLRSKRVSKQAFLSTVLQLLANPDLPDFTQAQILQIVTENTDSLLNCKDVDGCSILSQIIAIFESVPVSSLVLKAQFCTNITTLMIALAYHTNRPLRFHGFIEKHLVTILSLDDVPETVLLRSTVSECVAALEEAYPGLFSHKLGHFRALASAQTSVAAQAYTRLHSITFRNAVSILVDAGTQQPEHGKRTRQAAEGEGSSKENGNSKAHEPSFISHIPENLRSVQALTFDVALTTSEEAMKLFYVPLEVRNHPLPFSTAAPTQRVDTAHDIFKQSVSYILSETEAMAAPVALYTISQVISAVRLTTHAQKMFKVLLHRLGTTNNVCAAHALLLFLSSFKGIKATLHRQDIKTFRNRLLEFLSDPQLDGWKRNLLAVFCFADRTLLGTPTTLKPYYPLEFDSFPLRMQKLQMLGALIAERMRAQPDLPDSASDASDNKSVISESSTLYEVVADSYSDNIEDTGAFLHAALSTFNSFILHRPASTATLYLLRATFNLFTTTSLSKSLLGAFVEGVVVRDPAAIPLVVDFVFSVIASCQQQNSHSTLVGSETLAIGNASDADGESTQEAAIAILRNLLEYFTSLPCSRTFVHVDPFLSLLLSASKIPSISPAPYLVYLNRLLAETPLGKSTDWARGYHVIQICHRVMFRQHEAHEQSHLVQSLPLGDVLTHLWHNYRNIDVKDQARFYYSLLTNIAPSTRIPLLNISTKAFSSTTFEDYCPEGALDDKTTSQNLMVKDAKHKLLTLARTDTVPRGGTSTAPTPRARKSIRRKRSLLSAQHSLLTAQASMTTTSATTRGALEDSLLLLETEESAEALEADSRTKEANGTAMGTLKAEDGVSNRNSRSNSGASNTLSLTRGDSQNASDGTLAASSDGLPLSQASSHQGDGVVDAAAPCGNDGAHDHPSRGSFIRRKHFICANVDTRAVLVDYAQHLDSVADTISIEIPCVLSYVVRFGVVKVANCPERLFSIELNFHEKDGTRSPCFKQISPVLIPTLTRRIEDSVPSSPLPTLDATALNTSLNAQQNVPSPPSQWAFSASCIPLRPRPTTLVAEAMYTDGETGCWRASINSLPIQFKDYFHEILLPPLCREALARHFRVKKEEPPQKAKDLRSGDASKSGSEHVSQDKEKGGTNAATTAVAPDDAAAAEAKEDEFRRAIAGLGPVEAVVAYKQAIFASLWALYNDKSEAHGFHSSVAFALTGNAALEAILTVFQRFIVCMDIQGSVLKGGEEDGSDESEQGLRTSHTGQPAPEPLAQRIDEERSASAESEEPPAVTRTFFDMMEDEDSQGVKVIDCLIFIPPSHHLLLRWKLVPDATVAELVSDSAECMLQADGLLADLGRGRSGLSHDLSSLLMSTLERESSMLSATTHDSFTTTTTTYPASPGVTTIQEHSSE